MFDQNKARKYLFWVLLGILSFLFVYLLTLLFPFMTSIFSVIMRILTPFLIAGLIAYLLHPIVEKLHDFNYPRWLAIIGIYLLFFGGIGYLSYKTYPVLIEQLKDLNQNLPFLIDKYRSLIYDLYESTSFLPETFHDQLDEFFHEVQEMVSTFLTNSVKQVTKLMDVVVIVAVIPVLVFYMLKDFKLIKSTLWKLTPKRYQEKGTELAIEIDKSLGNYIRGQLLVCFFVALTSYGILWLIGMKYPLLLAILMGVTNIIPYFGPILGSVPAIIIGFTISMKMVIYVILGVFVVQIIEGNLLSPFIVGKSINIHPILIILALLVGGELGGIIGMIIAVPVLTIVKVLVMHTRTFRGDH
ncbi:AI-2E family transporter [Aquibacillus kalidii]|uniref:AI-2E family transporter n=1 Tax=Aquibacillus kalidii TaxID=2762597 RepID=UPI001647BBFA|nr:AI-2E family transporter [Aquibacillus kalidii]